MQIGLEELGALCQDLKKAGGPEVFIPAIFEAVSWIIRDELAKNLVSATEFEMNWGIEGWAGFLGSKALSVTGHSWSDVELLEIADLIVQNYGKFERGPIPLEVKLQMLPPLKAYRCCAPGCGVSTKLELDHVRAVTRGGPNAPANLQWLCRTHNARKGSRRFIAY